jgi:hypothetical protein
MSSAVPATAKIMAKSDIAAREMSLSIFSSCSVLRSAKAKLVPMTTTAKMAMKAKTFMRTSWVKVPPAMVSTRAAENRR